MKIGQRVRVTTIPKKIYAESPRTVFEGEVEYISHCVFGVRGYHAKYKKRLWSQSRPVLESFQKKDRHSGLIKVEVLK